MIEYLQDHVLYDNPIPHVRSRHAYFPGVIQLASGELLAVFVLGEAFESADQTTYVSRSKDRGHTWQLQGPLYDKSTDSIPTSDYLKAQVLRNGKLIALGYRFHRHDPESPLALPETDGALPGDNVVSSSDDDGHTWTIPQIIPRSTPELMELPSRCIHSRSGDILATGGLMKMPDGANPSGAFGMLLRSKDGGKTWDDRTHFFDTPSRTIAAYESHLCEMQDGRLVTIAWAYDVAERRSFNNHVTVSHDNGHSWSAPIDTGHKAESSNLLWLGGEHLMSIHCHRGEEVGLCVRIVDFTGDRWKVLEEKMIWGSSHGRTSDGKKFFAMVKALRFGQASLLRLDNGEILATHWAREDGQGRIRTHRLRVTGL